MLTHEKLLKPVVETKYLNVENTDRYRSIIRLFYLKYERLKYWLYQEDVYEELKEDPYFAEYTMEQCQQDLATLVEWKNLFILQDARKAATLEEFKNKKFRYQLSEYTVEIERMVTRLESLFIEGASLEPAVLERIRMNIKKIPEIAENDQEQIYSWWNDLSNDFVRLNQNYQDYMRELNSVKAEELMRTKEFLIFKDRLIDYLRTFVKGLQMNVTVIEDYLKNLKEEYMETILRQIMDYELSIPHIKTDVDEEKVKEKILGRWKSMKEWFLGEGGRESEAFLVLEMASDIIRKITRYATRISEQNNSGANRREEYHKIAQMFSKCATIEEAHRLSAYVFGVEAPLHLKGNFMRETDSIYSGVYEEKPYIVEVLPRIRTYKEKAKRSGIVDRTKDKERVQKVAIQRAEEERKLFERYIIDGALEFDKLPVIEPQVRNIFLMWLSKALERKDFHGRTEDGREYYIENGKEKERCVVKCTDGYFTMPAYKIVIKE